MPFALILGAIALIAGAIASVTGFGIGSLVTPILATSVEMKLAVAAVTIPHFIGSAQRLWILRRNVDRQVLLGFGLASAIVRTAAMLGFNVPKESFVATSAAIALFVDGARLPVYLIAQGDVLLRLWPQLLLMTIAVVIGTWAGTRILSRIPQQTFRRVIGALLLVLGIYMIVAGQTHLS